MRQQDIAQNVLKKICMSVCTLFFCVILVSYIKLVYAAPVSGIRASSNQLLNSDNAVVHLHGVNRSGTEYACVQGWGIFDGPNTAQSVQAMTTWNINVVRVPLNEDCWLGINGVPLAYSGSIYRQAIVHYVDLLNSYGMYVILDLHWSAPGTLLATKNQPMANSDHSAAFWASVAGTFKSNPSVIFDLINEPHPDANQDTAAAWVCTEYGGTCPGVSYQTIGMQELVNSVRSTGATNLILVGGVQYANSLTKWLDYMPFDPLHNIAASWHVYPELNLCNNVDCYASEALPVLAKVPIIAGEIGDPCTASSFIELMNWLDANSIGYLAWTWDAWGGNTCDDFSLIRDYSGTPSAIGSVYKSHILTLSGESFQPHVSQSGSQIAPSVSAPPHASSSARVSSPSQGEASQHKTTLLPATKNPSAKVLGITSHPPEPTVTMIISPLPGKSILHSDGTHSISANTTGIILFASEYRNLLDDFLAVCILTAVCAGVFLIYELRHAFAGLMPQKDRSNPEIYDDGFSYAIEKNFESEEL